MKVALHSKPWAVYPSLQQKPWIIGQTPTDGLTIEVMWDGGIVSEVVEKLKTVSVVEIIEYKSYQHDNCMKILVSLSPPSNLL